MHGYYSRAVCTVDRFMVFELFFGIFFTVHSPVKPTKQPYWARAAALCHKSAVLFVSLPYPPKTYTE